MDKNSDKTPSWIFIGPHETTQVSNIKTTTKTENCKINKIIYIYSYILYITDNIEECSRSKSSKVLKQMHFNG
jgi:hypothetical protein